MESYEIFKDIKGYPNYQISNMGRVWSIKRQKYLKPVINDKGYCVVLLYSINGKRKQEYIHRLVALAFLQNPDNLPTVNHKNEIKADNRVDNLEWMSVIDNNNYGTRLERIAEKKRKPVVIVETGEVFKSVKDCAEAIGVLPSTVSGVLSGRNNTAKGFHIKFI